METWEIQIAPWILQDNNKDLHVGQNVEFAVEAFLEQDCDSALETLKDVAPKVESLGKSSYNIFSNTIYTDNELSIITLNENLQVFWKHKSTPEKNVDSNQIITGRFKLGVEPSSFDFDSDTNNNFLNYFRIFENLLHSWKIERIVEQKVNFTYSRNVKGTLVGTPDLSSMQVTEVQQTNIRENSRGLNYILSCTLQKAHSDFTVNQSRRVAG